MSEKKYIPSQNEIKDAVERMSYGEKELTRRREEAREMLERMGRSGYLEMEEVMNNEGREISAIRGVIDGKNLELTTKNQAAAGVSGKIDGMDIPDHLARELFAKYSPVARKLDVKLIREVANDLTKRAGERKAEMIAKSLL